MKAKIKKMILTVISVIIVLSMMPYHTVFAEENGSIEITETATNTPDKKFVSGVKLGLYKVADIDNNDTTEYRISDLFIKSGINAKDIVYADKPSDIAERLAKYTTDYAIEPQSIATSNNSGYLSFTGLTDGIYLVRQVNTDAEFEEMGYKYTTDSYIIAIPSLDSEGNKVRNVICQPKGILTELEKKDTSLTVYKVWKDDNDKKGTRPEAIKVGLYKDGVIKETINLSAGNNWMYEWKKLDTDSKWSVKEIEIPRGYTSSIINNDQEWTIINTYKPPTNTKIVKTGDNTNIIFWIGILLVSVLIIAMAIYYRFRNKKRNS